jgi:hypothetical protein
LAGDTTLEVSMADVLQAGSYEAIISHAVARRVDSLLRKGPSDWAKWFTRQMKVEFDQIALDWSALQEIFERRNIVVHNAGRVSELCVRRVPGPESTTLNAVLPTDEAYVKKALDHLIALGALLSLRVWLKLHPDDTDAALVDLMWTFDDLEEFEQWGVMRHLATHGKGIAAREAWFPMHLQCYEWEARKQIHGLANIEAEVAAWDTLILQPVYRFIQLNLLEEIDQAIDMLPDLVRTGQITTSLLQGSGAYRLVREHPRYEEAMRSATQSSR